jgi:hypothetical protein
MSLTSLSAKCLNWYIVTRAHVPRQVGQLAASGMLLHVRESGTLRPTALGRVASHFYIDHNTVRARPGWLSALSVSRSK